MNGNRWMIIIPFLLLVLSHCFDCLAKTPNVDVKIPSYLEMQAQTLKNRHIIVNTLFTSLSAFTRTTKKGFVLTGIKGSTCALRGQKQCNLILFGNGDECVLPTVGSERKCKKRQRHFDFPSVEVTIMEMAHWEKLRSDIHHTCRQKDLNKTDNAACKKLLNLAH